jgi:hypothetical protein
MTTHRPDDPETDDLREVLATLAMSAPTPPAVNWSRYRAELRAKLEGRQSSRPRSWWQPAPLAASAALAGALIFLAIGDLHQARPVDMTAVEEAAFGQRLDVVSQQTLLERLDLLEDLEVIRNLGPLAANQEG